MGAHERHQRWQALFHRALSYQQVAAFDEQEREDLSYNLADASAGARTLAEVRQAVFDELAHQGGVGVEALPALAQVLVRAVESDLEPPASPGQHPRRGWLAARRAAVVGRARWYTVQPWGEDTEADRALVRALLQALRPWAGQVQTDLPLEYRDRWPPAVGAAAEHLLALSARQRGDSESYATTGWLPACDEVSWQAFVIFSPYALDADVATERAAALVGLADQGASLALRLRAGQRDLVAGVLGGRRLRYLP